VTVGFQRLFTHRSFTAPRALRIALTVAGSTALRGGVLAWVADHRRRGTTDLESSAEDLVARYASRWGIEQAFADARQIMGVGEARNRARRAVERTVPFGLIWTAGGRPARGVVGWCSSRPRRRAFRRWPRTRHCFGAQGNDDVARGQRRALSSATSAPV
jgi:Transposase DDE domain